MNFDYFINQTINGLGIGSIYALVALGYTMVYGIVKLINFAHGDIIMVGSYFILIFMKSKGFPFWISIAISMMLCGLFGVLIEKTTYRPLREAPRINVLITAIGVSIFLQNIFMIWQGADPQTFPQLLKGSVSLFDGSKVSIGINTIVTIITAFIVMALLTLFIKKTKIGTAMRAVSEDAGAAALMGINVDNTVSITFFIGSALAVIGGGLYSAMYPLISPFMGSVFGLKAFIAAVFGGIGIIPGAMFGGLTMGLVETYTKGYISSSLSDTVVFSILIIILIIKPSGIFGKNIKEKV